MLTKELAINTVTSFAKKIIESGVPLNKVILFGSYANGKNNDDSDIDVALVSDLFTGFGFEDRKYFSKINIEKNFIDIETKTFSTNYFEKGDPFTDKIKNTGIEIKIA